MIKQVWVNIEQLQQLVNKEVPHTKSAGFAYDDGDGDFEGSVPLLVGTNKKGEITTNSAGTHVLLNIKTDFGKKKDDHAASVPAEVQLSEQQEFGGEDTVPGPLTQSFDQDEEIPL